MCIIRLVIRFPHGREIPFAYAWVFCLTLRTEDSDRDLRCPGLSSRAILVSLRQLSRGPGLSTQDTSTPRRVFPGFPAAHSPVTRQRSWLCNMDAGSFISTGLLTAKPGIVGYKHTAVPHNGFRHQHWPHAGQNSLCQISFLEQTVSDRPMGQPSCLSVYF